MTTEAVTEEEALEFAKMYPKLLVNSGGNIVSKQHLPDTGEDWQKGMCWNVGRDRLHLKDHSCYPDGYLSICLTCRKELYKKKYGGDDD